MKKIIFVFVLILFVASCKKEIIFVNPKCEEITTVEQYNDLLIEGARTSFKNYKFIDLRNDYEYSLGYVSNFRKNIEYIDEDSLKLIIKYINDNNHAKKSLPIVLIDMGDEDDSSDIVYTYLVSEGYLNVKNVVIGYKGLRDLKKGNYYTIENTDCECN